MKNSTPHLRKEFWDINKKLLKIGTSGKIYYTAAGKNEYRALFARHGYILENVSTLAEFRRVMRSITARQLEENDEAILRLIHDPATSVQERVSLCAVLGIEVPPLPPPEEKAPAKVVELAAWKLRKDSVSSIKPEMP